MKDYKPSSESKIAASSQSTHILNIRQLLARLRDIMAGTGHAQDRLNKIVHVIAAEMRAEVCSCYVMRAGEVLELFATKGLNVTAVHKTRLRVGEGLVGEVAAHARSITVADAPLHPQFAYRPETGEDPYHALMGVPILRGGRVRGVLVVQNLERRVYTEEELESLQTVAMLVAELIGMEELIDSREIASGGEVALAPTRLQGITIHRGLAIGQAVVRRFQLPNRHIVAENPDYEQERLTKALGQLHESIDRLFAVSVSVGQGEHLDVLEAYKMFARDKGWLERIREAIRSGLTAETAVQKVQNDTRTRIAQVADTYLRERLLDLEDLTNRLLSLLSGRSVSVSTETLPQNMILVARSLGPAELLEYDPARLSALVLEDGSAASHMAVIARAFDIPVVGQCTNALGSIESLDLLVVDGENAQVYIRPSEDIQDQVTKIIALRSTRRKEYELMRDLPAVTKDGISVSLKLNCGLLIDLQHLNFTGAEGVGLYRTEIPFMTHSNFPSVEEQQDLYHRILNLSQGRPVVFRTLDIGGDKNLAYFVTPPESNPALGWRGLRISLDRPSLLKRQIKAMLGAAAGNSLHIMFPMVTEVREFEAAKDILLKELEELRDQGLKVPKSIKVGVMIEVPSLLWQLETLLTKVDFVSVGTNDLIQYMFASDRGDPHMMHRYDGLAPAFLNAMKLLAVNCEKAGIPLSVCGEMAGKPLDAMALLGVGIYNLSMTATSIGPVKAMIRSLDLGHFRKYINQLLKGTDHTLRAKLREYAQDHGVKL